MKTGNLLIGTANGLSILNENSNFTNYHKDQYKTGSLGSDKIKCLFNDSAGNIFIGTEDAGINYLNHDKGFFYKYRIDDATPFAINDNYVFSIYEDRSGIIWIGTSRGLNKIKRTKMFCLVRIRKIR